MKNLVLFSIVVAVVSFYSCDKVVQPVIIQTTLDTTLYPGNFIDYEPPVFTANTNTLRNVLLEDYTGHKCTFCPVAATEAANIEAANTGRVFVVSIHGGASATGITSFQEHFPGASKYYTDHTNPDGLEISSTFFAASVGFNSNPQGTINRVTDGGNIFLSAGVWGSKTDEVLATDLKVNLQAHANYFPSTNGVFIHTETEFLEDMDGEYNIVIYAVENERIDWQLDGGDDIADYHHHNVHLGNVYNEAFGRSVAAGSITAGTKIEQEFSYEVPDGLTNTDMHFVVYVYDKATYEILQVIKEEF